MHRDIGDVDFTIFDTETTGLDPRCGDRIVEIAAMRVRGDRVCARFETLVDPQRPISAGAYAVNHISGEMVRGAPVIGDVLPKFFDFIKGSCLCSYNLPFDLGFLKNEIPAGSNGSLENIPLVDVLAMARRLLPGLERHALSFVAAALGIEQRQEHRALSDVDITWQVFRKLTAALRSKGITDLGHCISLFGVDQQVLRDLTAQKISQIQEAVDDALRLKIRYISNADGAITERTVLPKEIRQDRRHFYMIGFCFLKNEERMFRVDSILDMEAVSEK
ncbi:MAG: exonuclease domain-containing protein [Candidatus Omnitrophica bacterium]|nr:exonuclease domain-containing protein [Candidatus Omnitrophota bacterium]MDD5775471.1 exonuclease domain-containing protein [Candidatus Omnitrophota bacterium]